MNGGFIINTTKKGSGVPFDQALEQCCNRPAKVSGGIIEATTGLEIVKTCFPVLCLNKLKNNQLITILSGQIFCM